MKSFNLKSKSNLWKITLLGLLFILPGAQAHATEWDGEIFIKSLSAQATQESAIPDFIITDSAYKNSYQFSIGVEVSHPAIDKNSDGIIDDCTFCSTDDELGSWGAVEASEVIEQNGNFYLSPRDTANSECRGGLCIQIATDTAFTNSVRVTLGNYNQIYPYIAPIITTTDRTYSIVVKGLKDGTKYYYRFFGEEAGSTDEHYFPTTEPYSFVVGGTVIPTANFYIEIPPDKITETSAELVVHMPEKDSITVRLYKGNSSLNPSLAREGSDAASDTAGGGYFHRLTTGEITLEPGTQYKVTATTFSGIKTEAFFTTASDAVNLSDNTNTGLQYTGKYKLLAPLPFFEKVFDVNDGLTPYLVVVFRLLIGIAGLLSVIMIVIGGIEYMSTDAIFGKEEGKERVTQAILGLLIALGAWVLLNTINPDILSLRFSPEKQTITTSIEGEDSPQAIGQTGTAACVGKYGDSWAPSGTTDSTLRNNLNINHSVSVNKTNCTKIGDINCTSLAGLDASGVLKLRQACPNCELVITGGTECWLHKKGTSHGPGSPSIDIRATASLNNLLTNKTDGKFPGDNQRYGQSIWGGRGCLAEASGTYNQTTGNHWHCGN